MCVSLISLSLSEGMDSLTNTVITSHLHKYSNSIESLVSFPRICFISFSNFVPLTTEALPTPVDCEQSDEDSTGLILVGQGEFQLCM